MNTALQDPLIGHVIDGRYRVESRIAVGGMATVYRALDTRLDRELALKVMHPALAEDATFVERFIREAKSVARLDHPNIVGVLDQGSDGSYVYLAMEYVAGCTLRDIVRDRDSLQPRAVLDLLEPVLAGLGAAHRAALVHRDIKPENVLIGDDGRVKVADFGLVRGADNQTSSTTGSLLGTVSYLAPEQIEHGTVDPRTDVYACGILLYELLTGVKPHRGDSAAQVLFAHVHHDVPPPSQTVPGLAPALDTLVEQATARDPEARPADAAGLLSLMHEVRAGLTDEQLDSSLRPVMAGSEEEEAPDVQTPVAGAETGSEDQTSVVPRPAARAEVVEPTARIQVTTPDKPSARLRARLPRRGVLALIGAVLLTLGVGAGIWYVNSGQFLSTPGVYDLPRAEAEETLRNAGLKVRVEEDFSVTVERGNVIETDPARGERVRKNTTVAITVSRGPETVEVPNLRGTPLEEAQAELAQLGLTPGKESQEFSDEVPRGSVIGTDPAAGEERRPDSAVKLTVSRGEEIPVPDLVGVAEGTASQQLTKAGFEVELAEQQVHSEEEAGTVAEQSPRAGEPAAAGDTVTLTVSKGPEMIMVPDVRGLSEDDARQELEELDFEVNVNRVFFTGEVFSQSIYGDEAPRGTSITLWVR